MAKVNDSELMARLRRTLQDGADEIGRGFTAADDDWVPVVLVASERGLVDVITPVYTTDAEKHQWMTDTLPAFIRSHKGRVVATVTSVWMSGNAGERPSLQPDRTEAVVVSVFSRMATESWVAKIDRDGTSPPTLGEWENWSAQGWSADGPMFDSIERALRPQG